MKNNRRGAENAETAQQKFQWFQSSQLSQGFYFEHGRAGTDTTSGAGPNPRFGMIVEAGELEKRQQAAALQIAVHFKVDFGFRLLACK